VQKQKIKPMALVGCFIALVGSTVIGFGDFQISGLSLFGDILAFLAAGVIAMYFFIGQNIRKEISAVTYSSLSYFASSAVLLLYILLQSEPLTGFGRTTWLAFFGLAIVSTIGGQFIFNLLLKKLPASAVTMSILGEPIGTCILAYVFLHEVIGLQQLIGIIFIIGGLSLYFFLPNLKKK
jgi:drug/metabolite transporter (DMT)-like permease